MIDFLWMDAFSDETYQGIQFLTYRFSKVTKFNKLSCSLIKNSCVVYSRNLCKNRCGCALIELEFVAIANDHQRGGNQSIPNIISITYRHTHVFMICEGFYNAFKIPKSLKRIFRRISAESLCILKSFSNYYLHIYLVRSTNL